MADLYHHNRVTQLNGFRWRYDVHGRTTEKESAQVRWRYRYDAEHRLTEVISEPKDRNRPQIEASFRYDPLGRRLSKTRRQTLNGQPQGKAVTTHFVWDSDRLPHELSGIAGGGSVVCDYHAWEYIVRGGDDADSVDAMTGQIAGALYGYSGIPQEWRDRLVQEKKLPPWRKRSSGRHLRKRHNFEQNRRQRF